MNNLPAWKKYLYAFFGLLGLCILIFVVDALMKVVLPNVHLKNVESTYVYVHTGDDFDKVVFRLQQEGIIENEASFRWAAQKAGYPDKIRPGRYKVTDGMNNYQLIRLLGSGRQEPVRLTFNKFRTIETFVSAVSNKLEADSAELRALLTDDVFLRQYGFNHENSLALFIPDTYEFYWNTSAKSFFEKMEKAWEKFWTAERRMKAERQHLRIPEVMIIASIVEEETEYKPERKTIAGVYLNRYRSGMKLQADPTVRFAVGDFSIKRIAGNILFNPSPYNTYKYTGLPPGPICIPSISSIFAVLDAPQHPYFYFCASEKFDGTHNFSASYAQHMIFAKRYQQALDKKNIH